MPIINKRDKSPENSELVTRGIELARPGVMRPHWNKNLGREIYVPRKPEENERREIKRIDLRLKRKEGESCIGGYFRDFGDEMQHKTRRTEKKPTAKMKPTEKPSLPSQTIQKKRWQHTKPEPTPQNPFQNTATARSKK